MKSTKPDDISTALNESLLDQSISTVMKSPVAVFEASIKDQTIDEDSEPEIEIKELNPLKNTFMMLLVATGGYYFGFFVGVFNSLGSGILKNVYGFEDEAKLAVIIGRINMFFTVGNLIGVLIVTYLTNKIGRRRLLILSEILCFILYFCYTIENIHVLLGVRFLGGVAGGINSALVPIFITEMIPKSKSGVGNIFSCVVSVSFTFIALAQEYLFGLPLLLENWKFVLVWPLMISAARIVLMLLFIRTETPVHYLKASRGNSQKAKKRIIAIFEQIYQKECVEIVYANLLESEGAKSEEFNEIKLIGKKVEKPEAGLLSKKYRLRLLTGIVLQIGQQLSGINFLIFFSRDFFQRVSQNGGAMAFVIGAANIIGALLGLKFINYFGRKANMQFGVLVQGLSFLAIYGSIKFNYFILVIPPIAVSVYMASFAQGMGATLVSFLTEILPPAGVGYSFIVQYIVSSVIAGFSQQLVSLIGCENIILLFAAVCFVLFVVLDVLVIETKGKNGMQITKEYLEFKYRPLRFK